MTDRADITVLGIETSCDETAVAVVRRLSDGTGEIMSNVVRSQWQEHAPYGGVVPEIAARAHLECLDDLTAAALREARIDLDRIDLIAGTAGPGLIGGLLVGLTFAKSLALATNIPVAAINHLEGHALTVGLTDRVQPPYLLLLVSGGHTQTVLVRDVGDYLRIGTTIDDALGEAFDKTAKLLGLEAPGGPAVERWAADGAPHAIPFPRPMLGRDEPHFSFAGLKTAVRRAAEAAAPLTDRAIADICASFQAAVADCVVDRVAAAIGLAREQLGGALPALVIAGGVAANQTLRSRLSDLADRHNVKLVAPPPALCTDNAAMIAWAAAERSAVGKLEADSFATAARARWPLDEVSAPVYGSGRLGVKA